MLIALRGRVGILRAAAVAEVAAFSVKHIMSHRKLPHTSHHYHYCAHGYHHDITGPRIRPNPERI